MNNCLIAILMNLNGQNKGRNKLKYYNMRKVNLFKMQFLVQVHTIQILSKPQKNQKCLPKRKRTDSMMKGLKIE
jgi:hypothetical protein